MELELANTEDNSYIINKRQFMSYSDFTEYYDFLSNCLSNSYDDNEPLHEHHIVPHFLWSLAGRTESNVEVVKLSVDDHIKAHQILSKCYPYGSEGRIGNLHSVKMLSKADPKFRNELNELYESMRGENNWAKRPEVRKKITNGLLRFYENNDSAQKGKTYFEIYGPKSALEQKLKRAKKTRTDEEYAKSAAKTGDKLRGRVPHNAESVEVQGVVYGSKRGACRELGLHIFQLADYQATGVHPRELKVVIINGIEYPNKTEAANALGLKVSNFHEKVKRGVIKCVKKQILTNKIIKNECK
tara:strand:+ start:89 stop:988 length:900 start_codon:yes stop_codon:yes gene_type:complete